MKIRSLVTATVLAAALTALSACSSPATGNPEPGSTGASVSNAADSGGGDQSSADGQTADDQSTDVQDSGDATDDQSSDDGSSDADDGAVDQGGVDQPGADDTDSGDPDAAGDPAFCTQLIAAEKQLDSINQSFTSGDMGSVTKTITADIGVFQKLADSAPSIIQPAMQDLITALGAASKALGGSAPDPSAMAGLANMTGDITALGNYISNNCAADAG